MAQKDFLHCPIHYGKCSLEGTRREGMLLSDPEKIQDMLFSLRQQSFLDM